MKILVFGLGALGIVFATSLKASGETVYGITKDKYIGKIKDKILEIRGLFGQKRAQLDEIFTSTEQILDRDIDLVIVSVKAYDTETVISQIKPILGQNTLVLLAQNGYGNYEIASSIIGKHRVILSRIIFGARIVETGVSEVTVFADDVIIGQPDRMISEQKLNEIANILNKAGVPTRVSEDVYAILWDKILYNSALNPLGAILECSYGTLAEHQETREIMNKIIEEIFKVAELTKIKLNWTDHKEYLNYFYEKLIPPTSKHFPSMYYDIKNRKRTEIDAFNGAIVKLAKQCNLSVPVNETIANLVKAKESLIQK